MQEYWLVSTGDHSALELCDSRDEAVRVANEAGRVYGETFTIAGPFDRAPSLDDGSEPYGDAWARYELARDFDY